eukprot:gene18651-25167_t
MSSGDPTSDSRATVPPASRLQLSLRQRQTEPVKQEDAQEPIDVIDDTPFPVPDLYFKVYESELDEPDSKVRRDVNLLYERWMTMHGRRWPEKGLDTEDMVWLREESHKPDAMKLLAMERDGVAPPPEDAYINPAQVDMVAAEKQMYDGEFITEPGEEIDGKPASRPLMSNYEATKAGAKWVTDEFESENYEAGNLELMWDMYLWDRDGNSLIMPNEPADPQAGEESEAFDDFHTAYRPRGIDTEDARAAVWATDEFESDEDNTESEWCPEYVGAGLGLDHEDPFNPQFSLRHSAHPLAPFPGEPLKWSSWVYDDGTTFEGLSRKATPHGMGVMHFGNGTGGGFHFRDVRRGDKYEGEFQVGYAHGLGQLTSENTGETYIGEFFAGQRHGCGLSINMKPFYYLVERGIEPTQAYQKTVGEIIKNMEFKTWYRNKALGSDYEDEMVLAAVGDDFENPYDVVLRNGLHDAKLKQWKAMDPAEKAVSKKEGANRTRARAAAGFPGQSYYRKEGKEWVANVDSQGNDTDFDSMELLGNDTDFDSMELPVGMDSDGGLGLGWDNDTQDTDEFPLDEALREKLDAEAMGLSMKDYLDGRESRMEEVKQIAALESGDKRFGAHPSMLNGGKAAFNRQSLASGPLGGAEYAAERIEAGDDDDIQDRDWMIRSKGKAPGTLSKDQQEFLWQDMDAYDRQNIDGSLSHKKSVLDEGTDTRFETESDQMELCDLAEILGTVQEATEIVQRARMWRWKPYGEVTLRHTQDAHGNPVDVMQDPLHYPFGTKYMCPGPLGQCHPIPNDQSLRMQMLRIAQNYSRIYEMYNFDYDPEPGTAQYAIDQRIRRASELQTNSMARIAAAAEEEVALDLAMEEEYLAMQAEEERQMASLSAPSTVGGAAFASVSMGMSFGMSRASKALMSILTSTQPRRPRIMRPSAQQRTHAHKIASPASSLTALSIILGKVEFAAQ